MRSIQLGSWAQHVIFGGVALAIAAVPLLSKTTPQAPLKPSFEVISIKQSLTNGPRESGPRGDRLVTTQASLRTLLQQAYSRLSRNGGPGGVIIQVIGGPSWIDSDLYDINAKADCTRGPISFEQMQLMTQSMLDDRFHLKAHIEKRELPVYDLVMGKESARIKNSADQSPLSNMQAGMPSLCSPAPLQVASPGPPPPARGAGGQALSPPPPPRGVLGMNMSPTGWTMQGSATPFENFVTALSQFAGRPIVDKTGLKGLVDFTLQFRPEGIAAPGMPEASAGTGPEGAATYPTPSLFTAIQELGLRLESSKGPVEVLVIDSVQRPTPN